LIYLYPNRQILAARVKFLSVESIPPQGSRVVKKPFLPPQLDRLSQSSTTSNLLQQAGHFPTYRRVRSNKRIPPPYNKPVLGSDEKILDGPAFAVPPSSRFVESRQRAYRVACWLAV
jgi:hypothetical protein